MKHQYFGDINDYKKYGLLRSIKFASGLDLLVAWMLTPDDGSADGQFIEYLREPNKWERYDSTLYRGLVELLDRMTERNISLIENSELLNGCGFFSDDVPNSTLERKTWFSSLLKASSNSDLVFLDPDNGLEIKSKPYGRKDSSKFLYWREVSDLWASGKSLLIYQHFIRENREKFIQRMLRSVKDRARHSVVDAFETPHVVFLMALQPEHQGFRKSIVNAVEESWEGQINHWSLNSLNK